MTLASFPYAAYPVCKGQRCWGCQRGARSSLLSLVGKGPGSSLQQQVRLVQGPVKHCQDTERAPSPQLALNTASARPCHCGPSGVHHSCAFSSFDGLKAHGRPPARGREGGGERSSCVSSLLISAVLPSQGIYAGWSLMREIRRVRWTKHSQASMC